MTSSGLHIGPNRYRLSAGQLTPVHPKAKGKVRTGGGLPLYGCFIAELYNLSPGLGLKSDPSPCFGGLGLLLGTLALEHGQRRSWPGGPEVRTSLSCPVGSVQNVKIL